MQVNFSKKLTAMTFAELALTLLIMGVIFAITVPGLKKYSVRTEMAGMLKKNYSTLNQAIDKSLVVDKEDSISDWNFDNNQTMMNRLKAHLNVLSSCGTSDKNCFSNSYTFLDGTSAKNFAANSPAQVILSDGTSFQVANCNGSSCDFIVDLNGPNSPNIVGYDLFVFSLKKTDNILSFKESADDYGKAQKIFEDGWKITYW